MAPATLIFTLLYFLFSICFVFPPNEFVSAGFTVECLFSNLLGSEDEHFVQYHIHRTATTLMMHSLIPFVYLLGLSHLNNTNLAGLMVRSNDLWKLFTFFATVGPIIVAATIYYWSLHRWQKHPIAQALAKYNRHNSTWTTVSSDINREFRRIDKVCITTSAVVKVVATDNWIIKLSPYTVNLAHQSDVVLCLQSCDTHLVAPHSPGGAQFLNIEVKNVRQDAGKPFFIRLNALDFKDLQDKVNRPIANLQNLTIHQTLGDRFLEAFQEQVQLNPIYETTEELEPCIGCMQNPSNVKLQKLCDSGTNDEACRSCYCRPMWCVYCMGKWFATRQDQSQPETWLGSRCPCPTCRATFCMVDVCFVHQRLSM